MLNYRNNLVIFLVLFLIVPNFVFAASLSRGGWDNRYFQYNGQYPYSVGMDLQQLANDTGIDYRQKLDLMVQYELNRVRIWAIPSFLGDVNTTLFPYKRVGQKFDLDSWDVSLDVISYKDGTSFCMP